LRVAGGKFRILTLAACCCLLAACTMPGSVKPTVKIGLSAPFEGLYRDLGYELLSGVRLAVRQRNEAGGVGGRYLVEQVSLNDFGEPAEAVQQAREMAADPGVLAVLGGWSPQTAGAAAAEYERLDLAFLAPMSDWNGLAREAARVAAGDGHLLPAAVLHSPDPADVALAQAFVQAYTARGGAIAAVEVPAGDDWVQPLVQDGVQSPGAVFMAGDPLSAATWIVALREAGYGGILLGGPELGSAILVDVAGRASEGVVFVSPYPSAPHDPEFVAAYRELSGGVSPGPAAGWAYAAANRLLEAMDVAAGERGQPGRAAVQQALAAAFGESYPIYVYVIQAGNLFTPY
jgi:branched-chain amino acid transport system substrate-binding protein